jgi:fluoride ion exporter CrcB/FEX
MAMEGVRLLDQGQPALAASYWVTTLLIGQMAGVYGMWLSRRSWPPWMSC